MESTIVVWRPAYENYITPFYWNIRSGHTWFSAASIRQVSMNCGKLANLVDNEFGNTGYSLRNYLISKGFITPKAV